MKLKVPDEMEDTRRMVDSRNKTLDTPIKKRAAEVLRVFAPGKMHGWRLDSSHEIARD
jgi:hypothetical protein